MNVYVGIGNTDNKLTQQEWADFVREVEGALSMVKMHGAWFSRPDMPWQNACWLVDFAGNSEGYIERMKAHLRTLAGRFRQDSIAWAVAETEFLSREEPGR